MTSFQIQNTQAAAIIAVTAQRAWVDDASPSNPFIFLDVGMTVEDIFIFTAGNQRVDFTGNVTVRGRNPNAVDLPGVNQSAAALRVGGSQHILDIDGICIAIAKDIMYGKPEQKPGSLQRGHVAAVKKGINLLKPQGFQRVLQRAGAVVGV